ncbi:alpha-mannosidase [Hamadaea flava]|uniref:Glycoside hydrolase family 38 C-terminal domain-containing protein n=1 Tax=Hamadaea flava TaxID=1742688 RepID=A0ABV8LWC4_9ACTN|nr:glycoside hydrolase family 38 C-terminal domain-containing protein [Hamadaea flava]MCP2329478.1 alpha-mannosidase [Hamadaea flava]
MRIESVHSTELFAGPASAPRQIVRVALSGLTRPVRLEVHGPTITTPEPVPITDTGETTAEVGVHVAAPATPGSVHQVTVSADDGEQRLTFDGQVVAAETGWTMWMVSHFHYDPVWWNTQAGFTEVWHKLPDLPWVPKLRPPFVRTAFDLVRAHVDAARHDPDYKFVLAEVDYLKPYWDVFPGEREQLRQFLRDERVELVGGTYNEPNTNLTHPESTIRNAVYGIGYQSDVLGGEPRTAWMLDVFGHDPAFPGLMADAGLDSSSWARGPFHMVGAKRHTGDITRMQFPSEFEWVSPDGRGLLTSYMANHYVAGWDVERKETLEEAMAEAYAQFSELKEVAATPNVMLPVGHDHNVPSRWCTEVHREWAARYVWPRFRVGLPREFFGAVRAALSGGDPSLAPMPPTTPQRLLSPQTRDMNPVYTGKDVSYIDTKQAQRAAEIAVLDAERLATLGSLLGEAYPSEALDKAWRLLMYGAHHDAVTGTESDQVYLDLLAGWREAYELGAGARDAAILGLAGHADTTGPGRPILAVNSLSWARDGITTVRVKQTEPGPAGVELRDDTGAVVPALAEGVLRHPDGSLAELTLTFLATGVPSLGFRVYHLVPADALPGGWTERPAETAAENEAFRIEADPARGGALRRIVDRRTGRDLIRPDGLGGELYLQEEYDKHPVWGEGPWHLLPKGPGIGAGTRPATVSVQQSPIGQRIVATFDLAGLRITQEATVWTGVDRVDFRTHADGSIGSDHLLRARFELDVPGALPVSEVGFAAIGRSFGFPNSDAAEHLYTLDNPAHTWAGLSATARIALRHEDGSVAAHAIGVAEVIADPGQDGVRALLDRLVACGVTATLTPPGGPRYGALDGDSNLPDIRIVLSAEYAARVLEPAYRAALDRTGRVFVPALRSRRDTWVPGADLRGVRDLPLLVLGGVDSVTADLDDATVEVTVPAGLPSTGEPVDDYSVAVVNRGTPGFVAESDGSFYLSLMRSCSSWPSGVWIDGPARHTPDGSGFQLQHWTHTFEYSLVAGAGDWRQAGFVAAGQEVNHRVVARDVPAGPGPLPTTASLGSVEPPQVVLTALKPAGNPMAAGRSGDLDPAAGVTVRLYESTGRPATARVRLHGGLRDATVATVLEDTGHSGSTVESDGDGVTLPIGPAQIVTLGLQANPRTSASTRQAEPAQPVFTRYWLHNKGPAPAGYLPVAVHVHPSVLTLAGPDTEDVVRVTVATTASPASGLVELAVPDGVTATPAGPLKYDLAPGEHAEFEIRLRAYADGTRFVAARLRDDLGQLLEDVVAVTVGAPPIDDPLQVEVTSGALELAPGGEGRLTVRLANSAASEIRGEALLLSPFGTWDALPGDLAAGPWAQGFAVPAGATEELAYAVRAPGDARPGAQWWAAVKVGAFGRVFYTATVPVTVVDPGRA